MAIDWNKPTVNSNYLSFVDEMNAKIADAAKLAGGGGLEMPDGLIRYSRVDNRFEEFKTTYWDIKVIGMTGGGTGSNNAAGARVNLGIGSMGTQNSNAVAITGGTISGVAYSASDITTGIVPMARGGTGSSLGGTVFGDVLLWNGAQIVLAGGANIRNLDATYLTQGTVPMARLTGVAILAGSNTFTGNVIFAAPNTGPSGPVYVSSNLPLYQSYDQTGGGDLHYTRFGGAGGGFFVQRVNDPYSAAYNLLNIDYQGWITGIGVGLTNLNGSNIDRGKVHPLYLGAVGGAGPTGSNFLRGDGNWVDISVSGGGGIPAGLIAIFDTGCPAGWSRVAALDGRFPMGYPYWGAQGGNTSHSHSFGLNTSDAGNHQHGVGLSGDAPLSGTADGNVGGRTNDSGTNATADAGNSFNTIANNHGHDVNIHVSLPLSGKASVSLYGYTDTQGNHSHQVNGGTNAADHLPSYLTVVYCRKD